VPRLCLLIIIATMTAACSEPPSKEMNQAQGAIDAARAAGAEQFAATELAAAIDALRRSEDAVTQNDYRLALSLAIDSRSQAQAAAKAAVESRAKARGDAERAVAEVNTLVSHARERLKDPTLDALPRGALKGPLATIGQAEKSLQKARAALQRDDYAQTLQVTKGLAVQVQAALTAIDTADAATRMRRHR
jgi:hypothetical protein